MNYDDEMPKQIFHDPLQARWKRVRRVFDASAIAFSLLIIFFLYSALRSEPLPDLPFRAEKRPYHALKEGEKEKAREKRRLATIARVGHRRKSHKAPSQIVLNSEEGIRAAFYVSWDAASFSSLREYAKQIDLLYPEWLHVVTPDGRLEAIDEDTGKFFDVVNGSSVRPVDPKVMSFVKAEDAEMEVFPMVNNSDGANWVDISKFLNDPAARTQFRKQVDTFLASDRYRGLMVDFEEFPKKGQKGYIALLNELSADLHLKGLKLYVSVQPHNED